MSYWLTSSGGYYGGDQVAGDDSQSVPCRPDSTYDWNGTAWIANRETALAGLRVKRDALLADCDYTQLADAPLAPEQIAAWVTYRQALRDLPENTVDPTNPVWPSPPE